MSGKPGERILGYIPRRDLVVYTGLSRLSDLLAARHAVELAVLDKTRPGLVELKGDLSFHTLLPEREYPVVATWPGVGAGFPACRDLLDICRVKIGAQVKFREYWRGNDCPVPYRETQKDRQTVVGHLLVFYRAAYDDVIITGSPVGRQAFVQPVDTFREEIEKAVPPCPYHPPALRAPVVSVLEEKVGGEAGENDLSRRQLPAPVSLFPDGQVEISVFAAEGCGLFSAVHGVLPVNIAVFAPGTQLRAAVPRVPAGVDTVILRHG